MYTYLVYFVQGMQGGGSIPMNGKPQSLKGGTNSQRSFQKENQENQYGQIQSQRAIAMDKPSQQMMMGRRSESNGRGVAS